MHMQSGNEAGPTERLEITLLLHGDNVSELCTGMATDTHTSQLVVPRSINGVLRAYVSPGVYDVAVFLMAEDSLGTSSTYAESPRRYTKPLRPATTRG